MSKGKSFCEKLHDHFLALKDFCYDLELETDSPADSYDSADSEKTHLFKKRLKEKRDKARQYRRRKIEEKGEHEMLKLLEDEREYHLDVFMAESKRILNIERVRAVTLLDRQLRNTILKIPHASSTYYSPISSFEDHSFSSHDSACNLLQPHHNRRRKKKYKKKNSKQFKPKGYENSLHTNNRIPGNSPKSGLLEDFQITKIPKTKKNNADGSPKVGSNINPYTEVTGTNSVSKKLEIDKNQTDISPKSSIKTSKSMNITDEPPKATKENYNKVGGISDNEFNNPILKEKQKKKTKKKKKKNEDQLSDDDRDLMKENMSDEIDTSASSSSSEYKKKKKRRKKKKIKKKKERKAHKQESSDES